MSRRLRYVTIGWWVWFASLALIASTACTDPAALSKADSSRGVNNMIVLEVGPVQDGYIQGEAIKVGVHITNEGKTAFELPDPQLAIATQPVFTITGPDGETREPLPIGPRAEGGELPKDVRMISIASGESWGTVIPLEQRADLSQAGTYTISATLNWKQVSVKSKPQKIVIEPMQISSIQIGLGLRPSGNADGEIAFVQGGDGGHAVYSAQFREIRPSIGEAMVSKPVRRTVAGADATELSVPWRNTPYFDEMLQWVLWREGNSIQVLSTKDDSPGTVALPEGTFTIVQHALKTTDGPLDLLLLADGATKLALMRIPTGGEELKGRILWSVDLPQSPAGCIAALGPADRNSERHVAFVADSGEGCIVYHTSFAPDKAPKSFASAILSGYRPLAASAPVLFVEADGRAIMALLAYTQDDPRACSYLEFSFAADGTAAPQPGIVSLGYLPAEPQRAALVFADSSGTITRRDAVLDLGENGIYKMGPEGGVEPVSVQGVPTTPMLLAPGRNTSYILYQDATKGLNLQPL